MKKKIRAVVKNPPADGQPPEVYEEEKVSQSASQPVSQSASQPVSQSASQRGK
jgi:hypothetical protein